MYTNKMKRKVAKVTTLRLSPNEETLLLKQEREKRRKLRLQQVREQERFIAQQIRQDVKERRDQQLQQLTEELRADWQAEQDEKLRALEQVYLSSVRSIGEGHRQAKENEPDLEAFKKQSAANKEIAERRHREALKELKQHKEKQLRDQLWHIKARKKALYVEKERAAKIASLPPPPPDPLENLEVLKKPQAVKICDVDNFSVSHYHLLEPYVDREMDKEQVDARVCAVEEEKRLEALQKEEEREKREQIEKAHLRGSHALKMVHLTQDREKLLKELDQMQQGDLAWRRQVVAQMPQQLFEPAYRRAEIREDWQRELESAFEDMYTRDQKVKGDLVLHLKPQPLPVPSINSGDGDLDLSVEPEPIPEIQGPSGSTDEVTPLDRPDGESRAPPSRLVLKRLLNKIRNQKDQWSAKSDSETVSDTLESGSLTNEKEELCIKPSAERQKAAIPGERDDMTDNTVLAGDAVLLHPQEQAKHIRIAADRQKKVEDLEQQKQEQIDLLERLEEQRKKLEAEFLKVKLQMEEAKRQEREAQTRAIELERSPEPAVNQPAEPEHLEIVTAEINRFTESPHIQMIRQYQQRLLQQNRLHKQSVDDARNRLQEYQLLLKKRYSQLQTSPSDHPAANQDRTNTQTSLQTKTNDKSSTFITTTNGQSQSPAVQSDNMAGQACPLNTVILPSAVPLSGQEFLHKGQPPPFVSPAFIRTAEFGQPDSGTIFTSERQALDITSSSRPPSTKQQVAPPHRCTDGKTPRNAEIMSNQITTDPSDLFRERKDLEAQTASAETESQLSKDSGVKPSDDLTQPENQSSSSSLWEYDSLSDMFYPLPSTLTFGLPQTEPVSVPVKTDPLLAPKPYIKEKVGWSFGEFSNVQEFRERLLSSTTQIQVQQDQLKEMQMQLDQQRESLLSKQKSQEEQLLQKQRVLEEQMRRHQESLEQYLGGTESGSVPDDLGKISWNERFSLMSSLLNAVEDPEDVRLDGDLVRGSRRELHWRPPKPPVTKTKLGPMLEQHELSAILEVETPTSTRRSSVGVTEPKTSCSELKDRPGGEVFLISSGGDPESSMGSNSIDSSKDLDISRTSVGNKDGSCSESSFNQRSQAKLSWREILSLEASASHDQTHADQSHGSGRDDIVPKCPANVAADSHMQPAVGEVLRWFSATEKPDEVFSPPVLTLDAFRDYLSTTTLSTGSFLTSENTDSSPINSEYRSELQQCNYSVIRPASDASPLVPAACRTNGTRWAVSRSSESSPNADEQRSQIQQIIDRYTKDLSVSLERNLSFHAPTSTADISGSDGNQFQMSFHSLDPKTDFNISTPSYAHSNATRSSQDHNSFSQSSASSHECTSQRSLISPIQHHNQTLGSSPVLSISPNMEMAAPIKQNQTLDSSASFHLLHPECTLNETNPANQDEGYMRCSVTGLDRLKTHIQRGVSTSCDDLQVRKPNSCSLKTDFNISTPSYAHSNATRSSQDHNSFSQSSARSHECTSQRSLISPIQHHNQTLGSSPVLSISPNMEMAAPIKQNQTLDSSASFRLLPPECTLNETNPAIQGGVSTSCDDLQVQKPNSCSPTSLSSAEILRGESQSLVEDTGSFHALVTTQATIYDSMLSEHPMTTDFSEKKNERSSLSEELPCVFKDLHIIDLPEDYNHKRCEGPEPLGQFSPSQTEAVTGSHSSNQTLKSEMILYGFRTESSLNLNSRSTLHNGSSAFSLASRFPEWDTESACGIMEEPELTLVSLNDTSVAESTLINRSNDCGDQSMSQSHFHPLSAEVDASGFTVLDWSSAGPSVTDKSLSQQFTEIDLKMASPPGNLQEAFLRSKKLFVERSTKRLEEIKQKDRLSKKREFKPPHNHVNSHVDPSVEPAVATEADGGQLKKVVEVRVCTPEDRKLTELEMHQRTVRLYNQLDEVKSRREEMMRQELYAKNRQKAKEFKKKTLEKLRSRKLK
ncbi:centrosomal protein of 295 kDa [Pelodytes ibericus]